MKEFVDRLQNAIANLINDGINKGDCEDLMKITDDINAYKPHSEMTEQEYADIQALAEIVKRHAGFGDGLDQELTKGINEAQRILMLRIGSRHWLTKHSLHS